MSDLQQDLDTVRFELNKWETQPQLEITALMTGRDPDMDTIVTSIVIHTDKPLLLGPGMKLVVVPE